MTIHLGRRRFFGRWSVGLEFKLQDLWVGGYWDRTRDTVADDRTEVWLTIVPMFPLHIIHEEGGAMYR